MTDEQEMARLYAGSYLCWFSVFMLWAGEQARAAAVTLGKQPENEQPAQSSDMHDCIVEMLALNLDDFAKVMLPMGPTWMFPAGRQL